MKGTMRINIEIEYEPKEAIGVALEMGAAAKEFKAMGFVPISEPKVERINEKLQKYTHSLELVIAYGPS